MQLTKSIKNLIPFRRQIRETWFRLRPIPRDTLQAYHGPSLPSSYAPPAGRDNLLEELGRKYEPTKCLHDYLGHYHRHFNEVRLKTKAVLEIGVDTGKSLAMWEEYFPNAIIHGLDVTPECKQYEGGRRRVHIGDATNPEFLNSVLSQMPGGLDIAIDDGSHDVRHQLASFYYLLPRLNSHGIYAIEDTGGCVADRGNRVINRLANLITGINDWPGSMPYPFPPHWSLPRQNLMPHFPEEGHWADRNIVGAAFYRSLAIVHRGRNPGDNPYYHGK